MRASRTAPPTGRIAIVIGTRPELIKLSILIRVLGPAAYVIHTGQHFDPELCVAGLDRGLRPDIQLNAGGRHRGEQIGHVVTALTRLWIGARPGLVIVHGDTNAAVAAAMAANALTIPLVHIEAGLRSFDRRMPEEHNRVLVDHLADLCCAPTPANAHNLRREAIPDSRIAITGNTIVDVVRSTPRNHTAASRVLIEAGHGADTPFILTTMHRPENVDDPRQLADLLEQLATAPLPTLLILHPRTRQRIHQHRLHRLLDRVPVTDPVAYPAFLALIQRARLVISDSGGLHEEATILGRRLLVVRRSTERPEAFQDFARLVTSPILLHEAITAELKRCPSPIRLPTPFGDGRASQRIGELVLGMIGEQTYQLCS